MTERHINLRTLVHSIQETLGSVIHKSHGDISEILAHLINRHAFSSEYYTRFEKYYSRSSSNSASIFRAMAKLDRLDIYAIFNKIYAFTDTPGRLLKMREDLLGIIKLSEDDAACELKKLDTVFSYYLDNIFNFQYLDLHVHNADNTPINLLKFIAEKEGVHPAHHYSDFVRRLNSPDRLILSLTHFKMPGRPAVYIEVALAPGIVRNIDSILGPENTAEDIDKCRAAVFYSVNKCMGGLAKVGLGEKMIIRAAMHIREHYPKIKYFVTLSPMPLFRKYLDNVLKDKKRFSGIISGPALRDLKETGDGEYFRGKYNLESAGAEDIAVLLKKPSLWMGNKRTREILEPLIELLARDYLLNEKRTSRGLEMAYDPVENFHLNNGALLKYINVFANFSEKGIGESLGTMVNYQYDLGAIEKYRLAYHDGIIVNEI